MFRPFLQRELRKELAAVPNVNLLSRDAMTGAIADARAKLKADQGVDLPACAMEPVAGETGAIGDGKIIKKIKQLAAEFREWLKTPQGQMFLKILKAIVMAIIAAMISGT